MDAAGLFFGLFAGLISGTVSGALTSLYFCRKASDRLEQVTADLKKETALLRNLNEIMITGLESAKLIGVKRDAQGNPTRLILRARAITGMQSGGFSTLSTYCIEQAGSGAHLGAPASVDVTRARSDEETANQ